MKLQFVSWKILWEAHGYIYDFADYSFTLIFVSSCVLCFVRFLNFYVLYIAVVELLYYIIIGLCGLRAYMCNVDDFANKLHIFYSNCSCWFACRDTDAMMTAVNESQKIFDINPWDFEPDFYPAGIFEMHLLSLLLSEQNKNAHCSLIKIIFI